MRKTEIIVAVLALQILGLSCFGSGGYQLNIDDTYFTPHRSPAMAGWGEDLSRQAEESAELQFQGIYAQEPHGRIGLVRQFDRRKGFSHVILTGALPVEEGTLVQVRGTVVSQKQEDKGFRINGKTKRLRAEDYQILYDTRPFRDQAQREYRKIRGKLQKQIALPGSRLQLSPEPGWRVDWCPSERTFVVAAHSYDLMYAAEVQFIFTKEDGRLKSVYLQEWFKGE
jgi:hypothetical protein